MDNTDFTYHPGEGFAYSHLVICSLEPLTEEKKWKLNQMLAGAGLDVATHWVTSLCKVELPRGLSLAEGLSWGQALQGHELRWCSLIWVLNEDVAKFLDGDPRVRLLDVDNMKELVDEYREVYAGQPPRHIKSLPKTVTSKTGTGGDPSASS